MDGIKDKNQVFKDVLRVFNIKQRELSIEILELTEYALTNSTAADRYKRTFCRILLRFGNVTDEQRELMEEYLK